MSKKMIIYGDGEHDDTEALEAWYRNESVYWPDGRVASQERDHPDNPLALGQGRIFSLRAEPAQKADTKR